MIKRVGLYILCLNVDSSFADVDRVISQQISNQIMRSTSNSISQNIGYYANPPRDIQGISSPFADDTFFNKQEIDFSNDEKSPPSYPPIYPYPSAGGFRR